MRAAAQQLRNGAGAASIVVLSFIAYAPAIGGNFVFDDDLLLTNNEFVHAANGWWRVWNVFASLDPWPLTTCSFWIEWRLWGLDPRGYHVTNILLHSLTALLLWWLLQGWLQSLQITSPARVPARGAAFLAALLFALHPVNVQSVAWITQRKNLLALLFLLLSIAGFLQSDVRPIGGESPTRRRASVLYLASIATFVLAMLSKGSVAVLPVLLLILVAAQRRPGPRDWQRLLPFFAVSAVLVPLNIWVQGQRMNPTARSLAWIERLLGAGGVVWFYLSKALLPIQLSFVYGQWHVAANDWRWWLPALAVFAVTAALWVYRDTALRPLLFAWAFYGVALLPVMGLTDSVYIVEQSLVADHYQHIALLVVVTVVAAAVAAWWQASTGRRRVAVSALLAAALLGLGWLSWRQSSLYRDEVTLFADAVRKNPQSAVAHQDLAFVLARAGNLDAARAQYQEALERQPDYPEAHNNYGALLMRLHDPQAAVDQFRQTVALRPDHPGARNNLGTALQEIGKPEEAIAELAKALQLKPDFPEAHRNLANALMRLERRDEALLHYHEALRLSRNAQMRDEIERAMRGR